MKPHPCLISGLVGLAATALMPTLSAAVITTAYPPYPVAPSSSYSPSDTSSSISIASSASSAMRVALNAQADMLKQMVQEHQSRAAELTQKNETEKAKWETELVNQLQEKLGQVQKNIDQTSETGAKNPTVPGGQADDELVFVSTVEARLAEIQQQLSAAIADSKNLSLQLMTNKGPETIAISSALGDNQRHMRELQKEQLDLQLRVLEFRALRKSAHTNPKPEQR